MTPEVRAKAVKGMLLHILFEHAQKKNWEILVQDAHPLVEEMYHQVNLVEITTLTETNLLDFGVWLVNSGWTKHSSGEYWYRSKDFHQWPPDETCDEIDLIRLWREDKQKSLP